MLVFKKSKKGGNYHEKISAPILSRVQAFELAPPTKRDLAIHLTNILKMENITFTPEEVAVIVNQFYPDIRKVIQVAQQSSLSGVLAVSRENLVETDVRNKIVEMLRVRAPFSEIRKYVTDQGLTRFEEIYDHLFDNLDKFAEGKHASVIIKIADGIRSDSMVANKQIVFLECIIEILKSLKAT
jgi:DNA polymerase III delta prime subunit